MSLVSSSQLTISDQTLTPTQQNMENATRLDQQVVPNENKVEGKPQQPQPQDEQKEEAILQPLPFNQAGEEGH